MKDQAKKSRHLLIKKLLKENQVYTQAGLARLLAQAGKKVTQATVSRDLEELGVYTDRGDNGKSIYVIDDDYAYPAAASSQKMRSQLQKVLSDWVLDVAVAGNLVILKTPPGSAHVIGSALDRSNMENILATIAGDDTVLIVAAEQKKSAAAQKLAQDLTEIAGLK